MSADQFPQVYDRPPVGPTVEETEGYVADVRRAGLTESLALIRSNRPGAGLRRIARAVSEELACHGYPGISIQVGDGMTRIIAAKRGRDDARRGVAS